MKIAIVGSRNLKVDIEQYIPDGVTLLVSGGAKGVDLSAQNYADKNNIQKLIFLPDYKTYGKTAPLVRNKLIVQNADIVVAIWDGKSRGTKFVINYAEKIGKPVKVCIVK